MVINGFGLGELKEWDDKELERLIRDNTRYSKPELIEQDPKEEYLLHKYIKEFLKSNY